ncbi:MAG: metallophosphoesterase [Planctomycetota bacterium]|nr:metallophosphoesterase [Planctomycetota bacterium]
MASRLVHDVDLSLPELPPELNGLRIAHLTDLHIKRQRPRHQQIIDELDSLSLDLIFFTGDYMSHPGEERESERAMRKITAGLKARLGVYAVFGNHDSHDLRRTLADLPVTWLTNRSERLKGLPLELLGVDTNAAQKSDSVALAAGWQESMASAGHGHGHTHGRPHGDAHPRPLRVLLSHLPSFMASAGDLKIDLMFSGHTHGGQCRLPGRRALVNSSDLPLKLSSGVLRHRQTLCVLSRGLGEITLPLRVFCPPHLPVETLKRGPQMGRETHHIENVRPW